jgi:DNA-binding NtrC family response regulator
VIGPVGELDMAFTMANTEPRIDGAVIDINLHGEMVFPLVDELAKRDIPVVFATGYSAAVLPFRLRHLEVHEKPVEPEALATAMAHLIRADSASD